MRMLLVLLLLLNGCGLTLGPVIERKTIIVRAGTAIECLEQIEVKAHTLKRPKEVFQQDIGGWIIMHPDHWEALKREIERLRKN